MEKKFISAGAGSGKTYRITTDVAKMVKEGVLKPEQVIMTTFTKAAAQELREKAKKELANLGKHREAQMMEHALIGTVHSVANTFLTKYWYLLGIMPDAAAMEENELQMYRVPHTYSPKAPPLPSPKAQKPQVPTHQPSLFQPQSPRAPHATSHRASPQPQPPSSRAQSECKPRP